MKRKSYYSVRRWDNQKKTYSEIEIFIADYDEKGECIWIDPLSKKKYLYHFLDNFIRITAKNAKQRRAQIQKKRNEKLSSLYDLYYVRFYDSSTKEYGKKKKCFFNCLGRGLWIDTKTGEEYQATIQEKYSLIQTSKPNKKTPIDGKTYAVYNVILLDGNNRPFLAKFNADDAWWYSIDSGERIRGYREEDKFIKIPERMD